VKASRAVAAAAVVMVVPALLLAGSGSARPTTYRTVEFSGYTWLVKSSPATTEGPGPNYFSDSPDNVWVDSHGYLHLQLTHVHKRWYCAEVISKKSLGSGRYSFQIDTDVHALDPNVVLGFFTWNNDPAYHNREIDIEFARFGGAFRLTNGDYVVQPYLHPGHVHRFIEPAVAPTADSFDWEKDSVLFRSSAAIPHVWRYIGLDVPPRGHAQMHINLWLFHGHPPQNGHTVQIVVTHFTFTHKPIRNRTEPSGGLERCAARGLAAGRNDDPIVRPGPATGAHPHRRTRGVGTFPSRAVRVHTQREQHRTRSGPRRIQARTRGRARRRAA
jgi:hypothetical protein